MFTDQNRAEEFLAHMTRRPRRNRILSSVRSLIRETDLSPSHLVQPIFVVEGSNRREAVPSMPGIYRFSPDQALHYAESVYQLGISAVALFPVVSEEHKDPQGSLALHPDNATNQLIRLLKKELPELCVMVDIALDPYTTHGHDGVINDKGHVLNDQSVRLLSQMAVTAAQAGVDIVAPSDMMDGRIGYIRRSLDSAYLEHVGILSYAAKYTSAFYGPYRDALKSAPKIGDKKSYQMDPGNRREAILECLLDEHEGADMLMVKPALPYLDVILKAREASNIPIAAFHVSGEYSMIVAAAAQGWMDADRAMHECLLAIKRAGADLIITYAAATIAGRE